MSPAHSASFHRRPGRVDGIALKRDRIRLRLAADLSDVATLIALAIASLRRSGHVRAISNAKAVPLLPDPSLGTIAQEARELIATARSRAGEYGGRLGMALHSSELREESIVFCRRRAAADP